MPLVTGIFTPEEARTGHYLDASLADAIFKMGTATNSVIDIGCGNGSYCKFFSSRGWSNVTGYEGTLTKNVFYDNIIEADFTKDCVTFPKTDIVLCLEVGEHIPQQFEQMFLGKISAAVGGLLILSWAVPGQSGLGHVNCRPNSYIKEELQKRGLIFCEEETLSLRLASSIWWFANTIMVFKPTIPNS